MADREPPAAQPQYPQPRWPVESLVPKHDFPMLPAEETASKASNSVTEFMDTYGEIEERVAPDDPGYVAALKKLNQVEWELTLLPNQAPEPSALVSETLIDDGREIARNMGIAMLPAMFNTNFDGAMRVTKKAVQNFQYGKTSSLANDVAFELKRAAKEGRIDSAVMPEMLYGLVNVWADSVYEAAAAKEQRKTAEKERDRALARAASAGTTHIYAENITNSIIGEGAERMFIHKRPKKQDD